MGDERRIRLSAAGKCPRMRVMEAINFDDDGQAYYVDPPSEETRRLWRLGLAVESMEIEQIIDTHFPMTPESEIHAQYELDMTPYGTGHPDLIVEDGDVVWVYEIKSSKEARDEHYKQLTIYAHYASIDPRFAGREIIPILYIAPRAGGLPKEYRLNISPDDVKYILEEADNILEFADRQELPKRTCATPADGEYKFCSLVTACFKGWEPAPLGKITDKKVIELCNRLKELHKIKGNIGSFKQLNEGITEVEGKLASVLKPGEAYELDDGTIIGYKVNERKNPSYAKAVKAGIDIRDPKQLEAYTSVSRSTKFRIDSID